MAQTPPVTTKQDVDAADNNMSDSREGGVAGLAERGAALANAAFGVGHEYITPLQEAGQGYAERLYKAGEQRAQEAAFYAELGYEETRDLVRGYPIQALGIAAGVGVLLGLLVARR